MTLKAGGRSNDATLMTLRDSKMNHGRTSSFMDTKPHSKAAWTLVL